MMLRPRNRSAVVLAAFGVMCATAPIAAQWLRYPTAGVPRAADGKVDLSAPAPRTPDGKPDFSGIWLTGSPLCAQPDPVTYTCGSELPMAREGVNMGVSLPGGLPYQPWLAA